MTRALEVREGATATGENEAVQTRASESSALSSEGAGQDPSSPSTFNVMHVNKTTQISSAATAITALAPTGRSNGHDVVSVKPEQVQYPEWAHGLGELPPFAVHSWVLARACPLRAEGSV